MTKLIFKRNQTKELKLVKSATVLIKPDIKANLILSDGHGRLNVVVEKRAQFHLVCISKEKSSNLSINIELLGHRAEAKVSGACHGRNKIKHEFNVVMRHKAKLTKGDILIKGVYENYSQGYFSGLIKIDKKAQNSNSHFADNVLLFDQAMVTSVPTLEIEANEVKASHGSTTGKIDANQLFYLTSRGLSKAQAKKMVINGFFQPVAARIPKFLNYDSKIRGTS